MFNNYIQIQIIFDDVVYHVFFDRDEFQENPNTLSLSTIEEGKRIDIRSGYYCYKHPPHNPTGKTHFEVYYRKNKMFAVNIDGSSHDGSSGTKIPKVVYDFLIGMGIPLNPDRIIEIWKPDYQVLYTLDRCMGYKILCESKSNPELVETLLYVETPEE